MEYKKIDELSISECCAELNIESQQLPTILENISGPQEIVDRLKSLVDADMSAFKSCSTIEQFEKYLELWIDGLHRSEASQRVAQLKAQAEELAFYKTRILSLVLKVTSKNIRAVDLYKRLKVSLLIKRKQGKYVILYY